MNNIRCDDILQLTHYSRKIHVRNFATLMQTSAATRFLQPLHSAWHTSIIPFLHDQIDIDQLWCSSKSMHNVILRDVRNYTVQVRPMDTVIRKAGVYPSYISSMKGLRNLTVRLYKRLSFSMSSYTTVECTAAELFSDLVPLAVTSLEIKLRNISWYSEDMISNAEVLMLWLDRFPNISLGKDLKMLMVKLCSGLSINYIDHRIASMLRYKYLEKLELNTVLFIFKELLGDSLLSYSFLQGIVNLVVDHHLDRSLYPLAKAFFNVDLTGELLDLRGIYKLMPKLMFITEEKKRVQNLPPNVTTYHASNLPLLLPHFPSSITYLSLPWNVISINNPSFPASLRKLKVREHTTIMDPADLQNFTKFITSLPASLEKIRILPREQYFGQPSQAWTTELVAALPRGLRKFYFYGRIIGSDIIENRKILKLLPRGLTKIRTYDGDRYSPEYMLLMPSTITDLKIIIADITSFEGLPTVVAHFPSLVNFALDMEYYSDSSDIFLPMVLPQSLRKLAIWYYPEVDDDIPLSEIPLRNITWPDQMDNITINAYGIDIRATINDWHLPQRLEKLGLSNITCTALPRQWPKGLRYIYNNISHDDGVITSREEKLAWVWPDLDRAGYYLPHSTICHTLADFYDTNVELLDFAVQIVRNSDGTPTVIENVNREAVD